METKTILSRLYECKRMRLDQLDNVMFLLYNRPDYMSGTQLLEVFHCLSNLSDRLYNIVPVYNNDDINELRDLHLYLNNMIDIERRTILKDSSKIAA
jgi:hypothetical protein